MPLRHHFLFVIRLSFSIFAALSLCSVPANGEGFQPINPDELKMTAEPQAAGAAAIILYREVNRDDSGHTAHENDYYRVKILKEEGRKYGDIEIPFFKENGQNIVNIHARTIRVDGSVVNFDGKVFEKSIVKAKGVKYMAKTFTLPDVQVGCVIEYYYTMLLSEYYIYDSHWILSDELFTKAAKFSLKPYTSDYSRMHVRWSWERLPDGTEPPKDGPDNIVRLQVINIPAFQTEDFMPPENELKSRVDFTYSDDFEKDVAKFWKDRGKKLNDAVEGFAGKRKAMEAGVAQIVSPNDAPDVKLEKIYSRVQQIRNTSYENAKTEQEQKRQKEKDAVKVNGKDVFCDPGAAFTPFGMLMWPETGVRGLKLDRDGGTWIQTPVPESSASQISRTASLNLTETGDLEGRLTVKFTGLEGMRRRLEERNEDEADRKKFLEDEAQQYIPAASEIELINKPDWTSSTPPLIAEFKLKIPGWVSGAGSRVLLPVGIFSAPEKNVFEHSQRVHPIYFEFPTQRSDDVSIALPLGWQVSSVPKPLDKDLKAALYALKAEDQKSTLHLSRTVRLDMMFVDQKYYPAIRDFFQLVRTGDEQQVILQPGGARASN